MARIGTILLVALSLAAVGCSSSHYIVKDPDTGKTYYTREVHKYNTGNISFKDDKTGKEVSIQQSEIQEVTGSEYQKAVPVPAAAPAPLPAYVALKLGSYIPNTGDMENFSNAFYAELGGGYYLLNYLAVEFGIGYTQSEASAAARTGASANSGLWIMPITLGLRGSIPTEVFEPFATAGIGAYYTKAEAGVSLPGGGGGTASQTDTVFGYYLGLGTNIDLTRTVYLGLEGKYFRAQPTYTVQGVNVDFAVNGFNLMANIGYRF